VIEAMKKYCLVLPDHGSAGYLQGSRRKNWPSGLAEDLKTIPASEFVPSRPRR
jgi:hypothetical protein